MVHTCWHQTFGATARHNEKINGNPNPQETQVHNRKQVLDQAHATARQLLTSSSVPNSDRRSTQIIPEVGVRMCVSG